MYVGGAGEHPGGSSRSASATPWNPSLTQRDWVIGMKGVQRFVPAWFFGNVHVSRADFASSPRTARRGVQRGEAPLRSFYPPRLGAKGVESGILQKGR